jgi:integrase
MGIDCHEETIEIALQHLGEHVHRAVQIAATEWQRIPEVYAQLENGGTGAKALQFMILTLVRSGGCRGARFDEMPDDVWTVPAARMKGRKGKTSDFRVPLSDEAMRIRDQMAEINDELVFAGMRKVSGKGITDVAIEKVLNQMKEPGRPHGFRTSFRTWVQDTDATSFDVAETILAHSIGNRVERTYARSDMIEKRRVVMQLWADFVTGRASAGNVVPIRSAE